MRAIKFRGRIINSHGRVGECWARGQYAYGDYLSPYEDEHCMIREIKDWAADKDGHITSSITHWDVEPDSVAQLIGTDANGVEVYEGDYIKNPVDDTVCEATMNYIGDIKKYIVLEKKDKPYTHYATLL